MWLENVILSLDVSSCKYIFLKLYSSRKCKELSFFQGIILDLSSIWWSSLKSIPIRAFTILKKNAAHIQLKLSIYVRCDQYTIKKSVS